MLNEHMNPMKRQRGVVLMITLIVLVVMALAGVALTRSVDTSNMIAGNLAFKQSTLQSADAGMERAIEWLEDNGIGPTLRNDAFASGYSAGSDNRDPVAGQSWNDFWNNVLVAQAVTLNYTGAGGVPGTVPYGSLSNPDGAGNTVSFAIQRMCDAVFLGQDKGLAGCSMPPSSALTGGSKAGLLPPNFNNQGYYRITVRVDGPRNTVSLAQALIAM